LVFNLAELFEKILGHQIENTMIAQFNLGQLEGMDVSRQALLRPDELVFIDLRTDIRKRRTMTKNPSIFNIGIA
jgi:hypothetical protein